MSQPFDAISNIFSKLPGLGPRSARRIVLHLLKNKDKLLNPLLQSITDLKEKIQICEKCNSLDVKNPCHICSDQTRDKRILCIVAEMLDVWAVERCHVFRGYYHVLGGVLSAVDGIGPNDLKVEKLIERIKNEKFEEIVMALSPTIDGQTTVHFLSKSLQELGCKISTLAQGIPLGGELDYIDNGTISMAFRYRNLFEM